MVSTHTAHNPKMDVFVANHCKSPFQGRIDSCPAHCCAIPWAPRLVRLALDGSCSYSFPTSPAIASDLKKFPKICQRSPAPGEGLHAASNFGREPIRFRNSSAVLGSFGTWMMSTKNNITKLTLHHSQQHPASLKLLQSAIHFLVLQCLQQWMQTELEKQIGSSSQLHFQDPQVIK